MDIKALAEKKYGRNLTTGRRFTAAELSAMKINVTDGSKGSAADGNFTPKGFEATPVDQETMVPRGEEQRKADPLVAAGLMGDLAKSMDALLQAVKRRGGLKRIAPSTTRKPVTTTGLRGMDAKRKAMDAAKARDNRLLEAARAQDAAMGLPYQIYPMYWSREYGCFLHFHE